MLQQLIQVTNRPAYYSVILLASCCVAAIGTSGCDTNISTPVPVASESRDISGLASDVPIPPEEFGLHGGRGGAPPVVYFRPDPEDVSRQLAQDLLNFYESALADTGWMRTDREVAVDGAWTAAWAKGDRLLRLTFGPEVMGGIVHLVLEQCPPLTQGSCSEGRLFPLSAD